MERKVDIVPRNHERKAPKMCVIRLTDAYEVPTDNLGKQRVNI